MSGSRTEEPWNNDQLNGYVNISRIGQGAYGVVWHARHVTTGEEVARKRVRVRLSEEGVPQSVVREIAALRHLQRFEHDNLVKLKGVSHMLSEDQTELHIDLVFEKCDWDLYAYLTHIPLKLNDQQVRYLATQLLCGLDFMHENSVVHRDLKPQNLLINKSGRLKIADFGLARLYSAYAALTTVAVTLWYRSPELLLQCSYGPPVDVWSAACIIAELYNTHALLPGKTELDQLKHIFTMIGLPQQCQWPHDAVVPVEAFAGDNYAGHSLEYKQQQLQRAIPNAPRAAIDFLIATLRFTPSNRLSTKEAVNHPFITVPI